MIPIEVQVYGCDDRASDDVRPTRSGHGDEDSGCNSQNIQHRVVSNPPQPTQRIPDVLEWKYSGNKLHPTQKPLCILTPLIQCFSRPGDVILDPFCGSGSTLLAAKLQGRRFLGIELDAAYCDVARNRLLPKAA